MAFHHSLHHRCLLGRALNTMRLLETPQGTEVLLSWSEPAEDRRCSKRLVDRTGADTCFGIVTTLLREGEDHTGRQWADHSLRWQRNLDGR